MDKSCMDCVNLKIRRVSCVVHCKKKKWWELISEDEAETHPLIINNENIFRGRGGSCDNYDENRRDIEQEYMS